MRFITETYDSFARLSPDQTAIHTTNQQISYKKWNVLINQTAHWLHALPSETKTIGILLPNDIPFLQMFLGACKAGWIAVPYDLKWNLTELKQRIHLSNPSLIVTTREIYSKIKHQIPNVTVLQDCLHKISQCSTSFEWEPEDDLPFYIGFTSGTTGSPKAFIRSQDSWGASFDCNRIDFELNKTDHVLIPGALIHSHFLYGAVSTLYLGGTVYLLEKFSTAKVLSWTNTFPITAVYVVPTMIEGLLKETISINKPLKVISSGAKWNEKSKIQIRQRFPELSLYEFYGASELSFISVLSEKEGMQKDRTVGKPCYGVEVQVRDEDQEIVKPYSTGKIYVRSNYMIAGYFDQEGVIQTIKDDEGWATVHDMGYIDEDGFLYITGREQNMILYGGINIFPEEIEKVISVHPNVEEVAIIGLSDSYWGQVTAAVIKGKNNLTEMQLKRFCKKHLSSYKIPRKWFFLNEMPYTTSGKIARADLVKQIESQVSHH
ncbi:AMP-binding protein [Fictibacillus enclensis]|uniref:AMP-binding protein n=1 Tax=Fictibacillus enclensis TaxID=1017270 RepID=UPI0024BF1A8F|nr:AMP-binding protein [Fictibacillus enclensis]WHY70163.1 AMP-binding protein [Fictibacillus enclensis]